jgi:excisionase family DNA binding protein
VTQIPIPPDADPTVGEYFARLRALKIGDEEGWFDYAAGDWKTGRHVVELPTGLREVYRDEVFWWVLGLGDGYGHGDLVLEPVEVPELFTVEEAADVLHLSRDGVGYRIRQGQLHVTFPGGQRRLIAAEVRATAPGRVPGGRRNAYQEWRRLLCTWPPLVHISDLPGYTDPAERGHPLAVPETMPEGQRQIFALNLVSASGLIRYLYVDSGRDLYGASITDVGGETTRRELPRQAVLPWLQGVADSAGQPGLVAYRPGLAQR